MTFFLLCFLSVFLLLVARRTQKQEKQQALQERIAGETLEVSQTREVRIRSPLAVAMELVNQAGMKTSRTEMMMVLTLAPILGFLVGVVYGWGWGGRLLLTLIGFFTPFLYLKWRKQRYYSAFRYGLLDLTELGASIFQSVSDVELLFRQGMNSKNRIIANECEQIIMQAETLGKTSLEIMRNRAEQSGIPEYRTLAENTRIAIETNSSLVQIYQDMNTIIRRYFGTEKTILAKTAGIRWIGYGLSVLPIPIFWFFWPSIEPVLHGGIRIYFYFTCAVIIFGVYYLMKVVKVRV
ncbi:hypothetical protein DNHGIG_39950 [Collibacillus ludicampi]|uniref:Type II secretion system protein GspF domain-containing protein n=1 Tax=Collibacillus ludicampi TaxID=2771369 RepID=A0AAV4LKN5_9BACL|nr:hypothetical protein [Collibacillus ludicampi]GIM48446.1 hypothetical protein DNHGIG_39950 [Collibacillus ludicampi]